MSGHSKWSKAAAEIRSIFTRNNGNLGSSGSVSYMFHKKGQIVVRRGSIDEERIFELALNAGAEELTTEESTRPRGSARSWRRLSLADKPRFSRRFLGVISLVSWRCRRGD
jgi:sugar phosphate isomerase/epimerase